MTESPGVDAGGGPAAGQRDLLLFLGGPGSDLKARLLNGPQQRPLDQADRVLLHRVIGLIEDDPRWRGEDVAPWAEVADLIGHGSRPQARELTLRERDDVCRMIDLLTAEFMYRRRQGFYHPPYLADLTGGDIARLNLIARVIDARGDRADSRFIVHKAQWTQPAGIRGWDVACSTRRLDGPITWQGEDRGHGQYYAAAPPGYDEMYGGNRMGPASQIAKPVHVVDNEQVAREVTQFLARYRCRSPEDAGMTLDEVARDLGLPWQADPAASPADQDAHQSAALTDLAFPAASPAAGPQEADALRKPPPCVTCRLPAHEPGTKIAWQGYQHDYQPPRRVGHHAYGADVTGRMVVYRPSMAGEVTADFPYLESKDGNLVRPDHDGLEQALEWARKTLADHPAVDHVVIQQSVQEYHGQPSKIGRTVTTIKREDAGAAAGTGSAPGRAAGRGSHGAVASAPAADGHRGRASARRPPDGGTGAGPRPHPR